MTLARTRLSLSNPVVVAGGLTAFLALYGGLPKANSVTLALPIVIESGWPGTFPPSDQLAQALQRSGFHLYVLMGRLAAIGVPIDSMFYAGLLISIFAFAWLAFEVARYLTDSEILSAWSVAVIMAMPALRGTLVWSALPWSEFVTGSVAMPMVMLVMVCGWRRHWLTAGVLTGIVCNIHPSLGSIAAVLLAASSALAWRAERASIVRGWIAAVLTAAPNVYLMARRLFDPQAGGVSTAGIMDLMAPFQGHFHIQTHLEDGIGFYSGLLLLAVMGIGCVPQERRRNAISALVVFHLLIVAYLVGVEFLRSTFIGLFFWFRATAFLKLLAIPACLSLAVREGRTQGPVRQVAVVMTMTGAACVNNLIAAEGFLLVSMAIMLWQRRTTWHRTLAVAFVLLAVTSFVSIGWRRLGIPVAPPSTLLFLAVARGVLPLVALPGAWLFVTDGGSPGLAVRAHRLWTAGLPAFLMLAVALRHPYDLGASTLLPESPRTIRTRITIAEPGGAMAGVERWARDATPQSSLFVLPPELAASAEFRARARRGVFVTIGDLAYLTYAPATFLAALQRTELVGVRVVSGRPDARMYSMLDEPAIDRLRDAGATHIVFQQATAPPRRRPVAYEDAEWIVYSLTSAP